MCLVCLFLSFMGGGGGYHVFLIQLKTQQGKKQREPETGTLINPSPVGERKPWF